MKTVILHNEVGLDAPEDEQDILVQAQAVRRGLGEQGHHAELLSFSLEDLTRMRSRLLKAAPELVFNLVEESAGVMELNYLPPLLLHALDLHFTGCPGDALLISTNKVLAKRVMRGAGIPTPAWVSANPADAAFVDEQARYLPKPQSGDASLGIDEDHVQVYPPGEELLRFLRKREQETGRAWFAEGYIAGREFNLSVIEECSRPRVLPPAEIVFQGFPQGKLQIVGYKAKWQKGSFEYENTPRRFDFPVSDQPLLEQLSKHAVMLWQLFGLKGYCRVDFRVDERGNPWVLEINGNPSIAPDSGFVAAAAEAGLDYIEVLRLIVEAALGPCCTS